MKKILTSLLKTSSIILFISACTPTTPISNTTSSATPNPIVSQNPIDSVNIVNKNAVIAVYKCVKTKAPVLSGTMDGYISFLEAMTDAKWATDYEKITKSLPGLEKGYGCKL